MNNLKVVFMGTPDFAVPVLEELIKNCNVTLVVSQPDKEVGRKRILTPTKVKECATKHNIEVFQPIKIRKDYERILEEKPDIIVTCAYGQIIPKELLDLPRLGCINVHASLLPYLRGGAPIHHSIIDGYDKTGVTIMYMDEKMDEGDIITQEELIINPTDTTGILFDKLSIIGANLLIKTLPSIIDGTNSRTKQDNNKATYAYNIKREEEQIDFNKKVIEVDRLVRGLSPYPLSNFIYNNTEYKVVKGHFKECSSIPNKIMEITKKTLGIGCLDGIYYIDIIKPFGKKEMDIVSFINGIKKEEWEGKNINE